MQAMRLAMADHRRARELRAMRTASELQLRSAAVREMRAVMMRLAKGEVAMVVERWRSCKNLEYSAARATLRRQARQMARRRLVREFVWQLQGRESAGVAKALWEWRDGLMREVTEAETGMAQADTRLSDTHLTHI